MKIALISLNQFWEDKSRNLDSCAKYASVAKSHDAKLVIFPEMTLTGFSMDTTKTTESECNSESLERLRCIAQHNQIDMLVGICLRTGSEARNEADWIDKEGNVHTRYAKVHPFSLAGEHISYSGGDSLAFCDFHSVRFGLTICYDLRFPELYGALARMGCSAIINIANWPSSRIAHWHTLLCARAIENRIYMIGVNRTGSDPHGHTYPRSSTLFDPNGNKICPGIEEEDCAVYDLPFEGSIGGISTKQDRKSSFYRRWQLQANEISD